MTNIEEKVKRLQAGQIEALAAFIEGGVASSTSISGMLSKSSQSLGGAISSIARLKFDGQQLITVIGRDENGGIIWKLNEDLIPKEKLAEIIIERKKALKLLKISK